VRSTAATGKKLYTLRGRWSQAVHVTDARSGAQRVLFEAAHPPHAHPHTTADTAAAAGLNGPADAASAAAPGIVAVTPCALPQELVDAADAAAPAVAEAAAIMGAAAGAGQPTLASTVVWAHLSAAVVAHDWHAARAAKHAVEEAQRVRRTCASSRAAFRIALCTPACAAARRLARF
jgi:hypothetical protein